MFGKPELDVCQVRPEVTAGPGKQIYMAVCELVSMEPLPCFTPLSLSRVFILTFLQSYKDHPSRHSSGCCGDGSEERSCLMLILITTMYL